MSRKIIGVTVGTQLPKPNFKQTDPTKGDYIKNKPDFEGLKAKVDNKADLVDGKVPVEQLPDMGITSWDDLEDKPFYEDGWSIEWDGDATDKEKVFFLEDEEVASGLFYLVKVQDRPLDDINALVGGKVGVAQYDGSIELYDITSDAFVEFANNAIGVEIDAGVPFILNVLAETTVDITGTPITFSAGLYFLGLFVSSTDVQAAFYVAFGKNVTIKQIDPKFIPTNLDVDLNNYYTKTEIDTALDNVSVDLSDYYTKDETYDRDEVHSVCETLLKNHYTKDEVDAKGYAFKTDIPTKTSDLENDSGYLTEHQNLSEYAKIKDLHVVATSGDYVDLINKPAIPEAYTHPINHPASMITGLSTVATSGNYNDLNDIPSEFFPSAHDHNDVYYTETEMDVKLAAINDNLSTLNDNKANSDDVDELNQLLIELDNSTQKSNLITTITSTSTDTEYPSAKAVYGELANKQDKLTFDSELLDDSPNPVTSGVVKEALDGVIQIAAGKCSTYVFESYEELSVRLIGDENGEGQDTVLLDSLQSGDVLLIRTLYEPDFWWEETHTRMMVRANTPSEIIVAGYGVARVLETTKVDLTNYALKDDIPKNLSELEGDADHRVVTDDEKATWSAKSNFSGSYNDLTNKPTIPEAYTHPDKHSASMITGLSAVATSGSYNDLTNKPTIPTVPSSLPANGGNADTVGGWRIRTASVGDTGQDGYITFIV